MEEMSRRSFLKRAGGAAAGVVVVPALIVTTSDAALVKELLGHDATKQQVDGLSKFAAMARHAKEHDRKAVVISETEWNNLDDLISSQYPFRHASLNMVKLGFDNLMINDIPFIHF
jgi:hypothetical protein